MRISHGPERRRLARAERAFGAVPPRHEWADGGDWRGGGRQHGEIAGRVIGVGACLSCATQPSARLGASFTPIACPAARAPGTSRSEAGTHGNRGLGFTVEIS